MVQARLGSREFDAVRKLVYEVAGIALADAKQTLVESRLAGRLRHYGLSSYAEYVQLVLHRDPGGEEQRELINCITTNKTSFFREPHHFDFLATEVLPRLRQGALHVWSAGCSTGEEPYTITMTVRDHAPAGTHGNFHLFASDIDTKVLATARAGVYSVDRLEGLDEDHLKRHFLRGTGGSEGVVKVRPELQRMVDFRQINLMEPEWKLGARFDVIFCRNVIIYFDRPTQERLVERFALALKPGGHLILGHSENIHWMTELFEPLHNTMYRLRGGSPAGVSAPRADGVPQDAEVRPPAGARPGRTPARTARQAVKPAAERPVVRIEAGDVHASRQPVEIRTLLGSCVAACLYDPVSKVGGMNHFMLPSGNDANGTPARYGVHAMELLINDIMKLGGLRSRLQAKVFGAASVIHMTRNGPEVGKMNAEFVLRFLEAERIPVAARQLGGTAPLEVRFEADSGRARVRALQTDLMERIDAEERRRTDRIVESERRTSECDVTLF